MFKGFTNTRYKNPWFWIGVVGVVFTATGINPQELTNWNIVINKVLELVNNPFMLGSAVIAVLGVFVDPTTKGFVDVESKFNFRGEE